MHLSKRINYETIISVERKLAFVAQSSMKKKKKGTVFNSWCCHDERTKQGRIRMYETIVSSKLQHICIINAALYYITFAAQR